MLYIAGAIILVIILIYKFATWNVGTYEDYLYGFWVAEDDEFCEQSEIQSMLLFVGENDMSWGKNTRQCYLIIMDDLCNQGLTLTYRSGWAKAGIGKYKIKAGAVFDTEQIWPDEVVITVDMRSGVLTVRDGDTLLAQVTKQHDTTNAAKAMESAKLHV